ncbi:hypothetical protein [Acinetobacter nectaris]|uniref:hypothetical protein n=1 Tax=Acinetobacter nectaris TaxID=1219382 RepID=UPI001F43F58E|nr:hypothetical protein [Acinetobacter nectaris]MCF9034193.1 hypothetical protein [Acinetobacter nectaris]
MTDKSYDKVTDILVYIAIGLVLYIMFDVFNFYHDNKTPSKISGDTDTAISVDKPPIPEKKTYVIRDISNLQDEFVDNKLKAIRKYKNAKVVLKNAEIDMVDSTTGNEATIYIESTISRLAETANPTAQVSNSSVNKLLDAKKGDRVDLECDTVYTVFYGDLGDCTVIKIHH